MMVKFLQKAPVRQPETDDPEEPKEEAKPESTPVLKTMVIQTGNSGKLYLREKGEAGAKILGKYPNGASVTVHAVKGEWARVTVEGKQGFMMLKFLADTAAPKPEAHKEEPGKETVPPAEDPKEEIIPPAGDLKEEEKPEIPAASLRTVTHPKGSFVYLRSGPHTDYKALAEIRHGTQVEVLQAGEYWSKIRVNGLEGYMVSNYLK